MNELSKWFPYLIYFYISFTFVAFGSLFIIAILCLVGVI